MSEVKCPYCGSECRQEFDLNRRPYWECDDNKCYASGPTNDPTGEKFVALALSLESKEATIKKLCGDLAKLLAKRESDGRDERLRVAAMVLPECIGSFAGDWLTSKDAAKFALEYADALIADVDKK